MEAAKEYFKNIDFHIIDDPDVLDNVYREIRGYETELSSSIDTSNQFEKLIKRSSTSQLIKLSKYLKISRIIKKALGSRIIEAYFDTLFENVYLKKDTDKVVRCRFIKEIEENLEDFLKSKNSSHALRKYFEFIYGVRINEETKKFKSIFIALPDSVSKAKTDKCDDMAASSCIPAADLNDGRFSSEKLIDFHKNCILKVLKEDLVLDTVITIVHYIKINYSKKIARLLIRKYCNEENLKTSQCSYLIEDIIKLADDKTISLVLEMIKPHFSELSLDKKSNYIINTLIKRFPHELDFYYQNTDFSVMPANSNLVLRILEASLIQKDHEKTRNIVVEFYKAEDNVFHELLLSKTETPDTKYVDAIALFMDSDHNDYKCNEDFVKYFKASWIAKKYGLKLIKAFLEGSAPDNLKIEFAVKLQDLYKLRTMKDGRDIIELVRIFRKKSKTAV